jgi:putative transposase
LELFPSKVLQNLAEESGFVKRHRKVDPVAFFWAVTLEAGVYLQRSLEQLRFVYNQKAAKPLYSYASFYDRFTPELVEFLHQCVAHGLSQLRSAPGNRLSPKLARFEDLLIQDSTVVRLCASLASVYPPTRSSQPTAGVKVATLVSVRANGPKRVELVPENTVENETVKIGPWVRNSILLMDLGFYKHQGFARIAENGGFYVTRLHPQVNPLLVRSHLVHRGQSIELEGNRWREVEPHLRRAVLDAEVEITFDRRKYGGHKSRDALTTRLVAVWNEETRKYHAYLTNVPVNVLDAEEIASLYRCRWEIELTFKELKSEYALDRVNTSNRRVVESLIWASILTMIVSRRLHSTVRERIKEEYRARYTPIRWARGFREQSGRILDTLMDRLHRKRIDPEPLLEIARGLMARAIDPNAGRTRFRAEYWS